MAPASSLFDDPKLLSAFDGESTVVDPGSRPSWTPESSELALSQPRGITTSNCSGHSWSSAPEPVWGVSDRMRARFKELMGALERDLTYAALLGAGIFLALTLVGFFATTCWRYGVVQNTHAMAAMQQN
jgi:hypothetical protein